MSDNELIAEFNEAKWRIEYSKYSTYCNIIDADGYVGTVQGREKAELIARAPALLSEVSTLRDKQAELIAEKEYWRERFEKNNEMLQRVNKERVDDIIQLQIENDQLKLQNARLLEALSRACIVLRVKGENNLADEIYKSALTTTPKP